MLIDKKMFDVVEEMLTENGTIEEFEKENGKIKGRMMITKAEIPENYKIKKIEGKTPVAFEASFDFCNATLGVALYTDTKELACSIWFTPQKDGAKEPAREWVEFFIEKLISSINDDGFYSYPIYSFVNDTCDITIIPTL